MEFDIVNRQLIRYSALIKYVIKNGNKMGQYTPAIYWLKESLIFG